MAWRHVGVSQMNVQPIIITGPECGFLVCRFAFEAVLITWVTRETGRQGDKPLGCIPGQTRLPDFVPDCGYEPCPPPSPVLTVQKTLFA